MKLVLAIVQSRDASRLVESLTARGYRATRIDTAGGFLRERNATILLGVEDTEVEAVLGVIGENCQTRTQYLNAAVLGCELEVFSPLVEVEVGGAVVFVVEVARFLRL